MYYQCCKIFKKRWRGSYTVEASVIVPIVLWAMALAMQTGIAMYQEIESQKEQENLEDMWEVNDFYTYQTVKEVLNDES